MRVFLSVAVMVLALFPVASLAQSKAEVALAKKVLSQLQKKSIANNREYCGYIGYRANGDLFATSATRGDAESCQYTGNEDDQLFVLSYHTHAAYDPEYGSEWPSVTDIEGDEAEGIDGFVATPGGRLWYIDTTDMVVRQLCGVGCLPKDPSFEPEPEGVRKSYTYNELLRLEGN